MAIRTVSMNRPRRSLDGLRKALAAAGAPPGASLDAQRRTFERNAATLPAPPDVRCEPVAAGGVAGTWFVPADVRSGGGALLHLHGGAFVMGSPATVAPVAAPLARAVGLRLFAPDYRLAPEHPFPAAVEDTVAAYRWLLDTHAGTGPVVLSGDSAGGGLVVAALVALRDRGLSLPAAGVCLSPWVDLTLTAPSIDAHADLDPQVGRNLLEGSVRHYLAGHDPRDPLASPVFADLSGLPPLLIHVGGDEALLDDARRLEREATVAGVDVTLECWEGMLHVWHCFGPRMPEAGAAIAAIAAWLADRLASPAEA